ncbi:unnamed protein product [Acanthosepion pharaonis]|uniref:Uncharacterized protein n=1 Tax=Acanthosepion pharaonis TaxID=158019 RepID=A0A812ASF9_ACAPH|nr:unnamed protein product [Sepia pharaonis]
MRMLQRHLAGEEAVDVGIEQANKVASTCNNESQDPVSTLAPKLAENNKDLFEQAQAPEQYHKKKLLKNATIKKHTVIPKIAKARKSPQTSPKKCSESHYGLVKMAQADQKPFLSAVTTERKILPAPPKTRREELLENLINYSSANFVANDETKNNLSQKNSEELDVRTEPTQLSKLLGSPLAVLPSAAAPNSALPSSVATVTTHCETPSVTTIATLIPVTSMKTTDNMPIPVTVLANPLPAVTSLENNQFFMGNLPAPLQENAVADQKPVLSQILPLPEIEQKTESERGFCPVLQIKKEIVTSDDEGYGGKQSDGLSGLRITGVTGGVTTHDTIPINSDAICSNAMSVSSHDPILNANNHQDWSVTRRRPLSDTKKPCSFLFFLSFLSFSFSLSISSHTWNPYEFPSLFSFFYLTLFFFFFPIFSPVFPSSINQRPSSWSLFFLSILSLHSVTISFFSFHPIFFFVC